MTQFEEGPGWVEQRLGWSLFIIRGWAWLVLAGAELERGLAKMSWGGETNNKGLNAPRQTSPSKFNFPEYFISSSSRFSSIYAILHLTFYASSVLLIPKILHFSIPHSIKSWNHLKKTKLLNWVFLINFWRLGVFPKFPKPWIRRQLFTTILLNSPKLIKTSNFSIF